MDRDGEYLYFYAIKFDGRWCLKPGITHQDPPLRNYQYIFTSHGYQDPDLESFRILAIYKFKERDQAKNTETYLKKELKKYPFTKGQHHLCEQYNFLQVWQYISPHLKKELMFCEKHWVRKDLDKIASIILDESLCEDHQDLNKGNGNEDEDEYEEMEIDYDDIIAEWKQMGLDQIIKNKKIKYARASYGPYFYKAIQEINTYKEYMKIKIKHFPEKRKEEVFRHYVKVAY